MSLVGPRPHAELALAGERLYWEVDNAYWHRHVVKPGITGLAQIRGHRGNTFDEQQLRDRLNADLEYVSEWSLKLGRASCRERVCQYVEISVVAVSLKKKNYKKEEETT